MTADPQPPADLFAAQQEKLKERLQFLLAPLWPKLRADVVCALEGEGKILSQLQSDTNSQHPARPAGSWSLLTLLVAQHVSPDIDLICASSVAVAVEYYVCAIDLLDDIIDEDQTTTLQTMGIARTLNVSTALLMLAQQAILSLSEHRVSPALILRLLDTLRESALVTTIGQHWDVLAEQRSAHDFTREECIEIAAAKAGSIMRLACRLGALCAGASDAMLEHFSEVGELLGIAAQLDNDCHDLYDLLQGDTSNLKYAEGELVTGSGKSDLARGKKTLPIVLAAELDNTLQSAPLFSDEEKEKRLRALHEGIITTWGICLLYRERARDRLQEIEAHRPIAPALRLLLGFE